MHTTPIGSIGLVAPALTAVSVVLLLGVAAIGLVRVGRHRLGWTRSATIGLALWIAAAARLTLTPGHSGRLNLVPFDFGANATPYEPLANVLLFVPLGLLIATAGRRLGAVVGLGFGLSIVIEVTQYLLDNGRTADVNDVIENTLGTLLGWLVVLVVRRVVAR
jgi:glycopeptide antibiotics resistance protein